MNRYKVIFKRDHSERRFMYQVDASTHGAAINKAIKGMTTRAAGIDVSCRELERNVTRDYSDPHIVAI